MSRSLKVVGVSGSLHEPSRTTALLRAILAEVGARSKIADRIINGRPTLLFSEGKFIPKAMKRQRVTEGEIRAAIREQGIKRIEDVDAVILENDGSLTVASEADGPGESSLVDARLPDGAAVSNKGPA
jgi:uncharacterized membrane protein YcaP (DUF421 family)